MPGGRRVDLQGGPGGPAVLAEAQEDQRVLILVTVFLMEMVGELVRVLMELVEVLEELSGVTVEELARVPQEELKRLTVKKCSNKVAMRLMEKPVVLTRITMDRM